MKNKFFLKWGLVILLFLVNNVFSDTLISKRSVWKYYDQGDVGVATWTATNFDDSAWGVGNGAFAYNDDTQIGTYLSDTDANDNKLLTAYFRNSFVVSDASLFKSASFELRCDDGAVVYLNGTEVFRTNMPSGAISYGTFALTYVAGGNEDAYFSHTLSFPNTLLISGTNLFSVEVHQHSDTSSDLIFDAQLDISFRDSNPNTPYFPNNPSCLTNASASNKYTETLLNYATDPNGDSLFFLKINGPEWLKITENGALSGTPSLANIGTNFFMASVTDNSDGTSTGQLQIVVHYPDGSPPPEPSKTVRYRISWADDPTSSASIGWEQLEGNNATLYYDTADYGRDTSGYAHTQNVTRVGHFENSGVIDTCFVQLSNLDPDTPYYFVLKDDFGVSQRLWFRTAPDQPAPFTFIVGGDSRTNPEPRRDCNRLVAKLRPLFVAFTGDMVSSSTADLWNNWFDDWQETISSDGRIYPILPHLGNHEENSDGEIDELFDTPTNRYYAISLGGNLLRYYVLNSEIDQGGVQAAWLISDLQNSTNFLHKSVGYHRPMRSHVANKTDNNAAYENWAQAFFDYGVELVFEADAHCVKRTWPIRPDSSGDADEGFVRDDTNGTVFVGEGCWGAPLRTANDAKSWTRASDSFYGFKWVHIYPEYMELFCVKAEAVNSVVALPENDVYSLPGNLTLWHPTSGTRLVINHAQIVKTSYAQWQMDQWGDNPLAGTTMLEDFDGDGFNNLTEFAYGLDAQTPTNPSQIPFGILPSIQRLSAGQMQVQYQRLQNTALSYQYEISADLMNWTPMTSQVDYVETVIDESPYDSVRFQIIGSRTNLPNQFIRVKTGVMKPGS